MSQLSRSRRMGPNNSADWHCRRGVTNTSRLPLNPRSWNALSVRTCTDEEHPQITPITQMQKAGGTGRPFFFSLVLIIRVILVICCFAVIDSKPFDLLSLFCL